MQYNYELLTPDRFQELCQALVTHSYPDALSFPVGKKDGGRDAVSPDESGETIVFQVKFHRTVEKVDAARLVISSIESELPKIRRLRDRGASRYVLVTNLSATAGLDSGERDRVQRHLDTVSPIPAVVWWREEVDARLNDAYDIKWCFSEILKSADILRRLVEEGFGESSERRDVAITAYLTAQYTIDESVKFKQADLQASDLLTLFTDVPASPQRNPDAKRERETRSALARAIAETDPGSASAALTRRVPLRHDASIGAATLLLSAAGQGHLDSVVLEGGPGQGKSTLAQYICQVHRMKILGKLDRLGRLRAEHRLSPARVPFKVDLRDLANWLRRIDPFGGDAPLEPQVTVSLESFLAAQVKHQSGGQEFSVSDLLMFLRRVPVLVVLDGLDEVAVLSDRREVLEAIGAAKARLNATAKSIQMIITTRPAATAATPRPSGSDWHFLDLGALTETLIFDYTDKWCLARRLDALDADELRVTLRQKLSSPHIVDLARNAMQLTILLQLIHSRGAALPDQRTQLYDRYVDILFNREADKNRVVRANRQLLIDLHGYVAWRIHGAAQAKRANGRVGEGELKEMITTYLRDRGHDTEVVDDLFSGVVQRIVALVSRVEGTFEFEVQPLREYFAGRHLYDTAPSSSVGNPESGSKTEIFDAVSRQPYWLNVTRFYAGCYSIGELAGLADQVLDLLADPSLGRTSFARVVATSLLADRVFQQSPRITSRVVRGCADPLTFRYAFGRLLTRSEGPMIGMPTDCGQDELLQAVVERSVRHPTAPIRLESAVLAQEQFSIESLFVAWDALRPALDVASLQGWLAAGNRLGTTALLDDELALALADTDESIALALAEGGSAAILARPAVQERLLQDALDGVGASVRAYGQLGYVLNSLDSRFSGWPFDLRLISSPSQQAASTSTSSQGRTKDLLDALTELLGGKESEQLSLHEAAKRMADIAGECWISWSLAIRAVGESPWPREHHNPASTESADSPPLSICREARANAANHDWWETAFAEATNPVRRRALAAACVSWATPAVLKRVTGQLGIVLEGLSRREYESLVSLLGRLRVTSERRRISTQSFAEISALGLSLRTLVALSLRSTEESRRRVLAGASVDDAKGDPTLAEIVLGDRLEQVSDGKGGRQALEDVVELFPFTGERLVLNFGVGRAQLGGELDSRVLNSPDDYPIRLIQMADEALSATSTRGPGIATTATKRRWSAG